MDEFAAGLDRGWAMILRAVLFAALVPLAVPALGQEPTSPSLPFVLKQVGPGVYAAIDGPEHKAGSNAGFVIGDDGVLVVDSFFNPESARALVGETAIADDVLDYLLAVVRATRELPSVEIGASPRASVHLLAASKAFARLDDRGYVTPDDVAAAALPVLRHRIILTYRADAEGVGADALLGRIFEAVPVP